MNYRVLGLFLACALPGAGAHISVAPLFTDRCVLQRDRPVAVWGQANPGETVTVEFHGLSSSATAGMDSIWTAHLPALGGTGKGGDLVIRGDNTITLHDVVVGEVWLCSGQSNMEFPVYNPKGLQVLNAQEEVAAANYPFIRQFKVGAQVADHPLLHVPGSWEVCSPATVGRFSAAGYFFAREIGRKLSLPVGIINSTWGGTPVESWIGAGPLASDPAFGIVARRWEKAAAEYPKKQAAYEAALARWKEDAAAAHDAEFARLHHAPRRPPGAPAGDPWMPSGLFNGMIQPLVPYGLRGILWYQGESNANPEHAEEYHRLFAALITSWRKEFDQGDVPFYWVQLAGFGHSPAWPILREEQQQALSLPNTGQAIAIDIGQEDNIHPRNKQEVGRRLALIAENQAYKVPVEYSGPMFANAVQEKGAMRVWFNFCADGLRAGPARAADGPVQACEVAGADHKFYPATAKVEGNSVVARAEQVPEPVAVRYAWKGFAEGGLYNSAGLPAGPFRSDNW